MTRLQALATRTKELPGKLRQKLAGLRKPKARTAVQPPAKTAEDLAFSAQLERDFAARRKSDETLRNFPVPEERDFLRFMASDLCIVFRHAQDLLESTDPGDVKKVTACREAWEEKKQALKL